MQKGLCRYGQISILTLEIQQLTELRANTSKLKKHLDSRKCDLDRFILVIEDIVKSQETAIKERLERSRIIRKEKYNYPIFQQLQGFFSHHAMKIILAEIHRSRGFVLTLDNCGCQIRSCFGLPCAHELAMHAAAGMTIPFDCIDPFWTKLDLLPSIYVEYGDLGYEKNMELFKETFNKQSNPVKSSLLRKFRGIFDASMNLIVEPMVKKNNRRRPKKTHVNPPTRVPHRHSCSNFGGLNFEDIMQEPARHSSFSMYLKDEPSEQYSYMMDMNENPVVNISCSSFQSFYMHPLMKEIPKIFHLYVTHIEDVLGDGNCGFRAVAACLGHGEDQWLRVREQLLDELLNSYMDYETVLTSGIHEVHMSLLFSQSPAPPQHWMVMIETGILIVNKFSVVLNYLILQGCITCFPIWKGPDHFQHHKMITIVNVHGYHYAMVQLEGEYPMPRILAYWIRNRAPSAVGCQYVYMQRLQLYEQLNPCNRNKAFVHLEDS